MKQNRYTFANIIHMYKCRVSETNLLDLGSRTPEEFNVPGPNALTVLAEGNGRILLVLKEHKGVTCGPTVGPTDEQNPRLLVKNLDAGRGGSRVRWVKELTLQKNKSRLVMR